MSAAIVSTRNLRILLDPRVSTDSRSEATVSTAATQKSGQPKKATGQGNGSLPPHVAIYHDCAMSVAAEAGVRSREVAAIAMGKRMLFGMWFIAKVFQVEF